MEELAKLFDSYLKKSGESVKKQQSYWHHYFNSSATINPFNIINLTQYIKMAFFCFALANNTTFKQEYFQCKDEEQAKKIREAMGEFSLITILGDEDIYSSDRSVITHRHSEKMPGLHHFNVFTIDDDLLKQIKEIIGKENANTLEANAIK